MSELVLKDPLASQLRNEAKAEGVEVETLVESALRHYRFQLQRKKINAEIEWWRSVSIEVRTPYRGKFVAVHNKEVIDHDFDEEMLRNRVRRKFGKTAVLIAPAEGRRELKFVSTHLA